MESRCKGPEVAKSRSLWPEGKEQGRTIGGQAGDARAKLCRALKGTLRTCDSGLAGLMVEMERGRWVKAHTGGIVTE